MDAYKAKHKKNEKEFIIGWFGICGGLLIFFAGLMSRHVVRSSGHQKNAFRNHDFLEVWDIFAAPSSDLPSFVMGIGRIIYFVSTVAALFTYEGTQMWTWCMMGIGTLLIIGSGIGAMMRENIALLSLSFTGAGAILSLVGLHLVEIVPRSLAGKVLIALAIITGSAAFPIGILAEMGGYSFFLCVIIEALAAIIGILGVVAYLRERVVAQSQQRLD